MSSVLHPVGPEPPQTYWLRRAIVVGAAILVLIVLIALIVGQTSNGSVVAQGSPAPLAPSPAETTAAATATPTPAESTASSSPTAADPTATGGKSDASSSAEPSSKPSESAKAKGKSSSQPKVSEQAKPTGTPSCSADQLRPTLTGKQKLKPKQENTFKVSLINGSGSTCRLAVTGETFELKIYSGRDRIWSSNDCAKSVKASSTKLSKEEAAAWSMTWDGRRSAKDCKQRKEIPRPGTYFATAQLKGAKPVQLRMILH